MTGWARVVGREAWWWLSGVGRLFRDYTLRWSAWVGVTGAMVWNHHWLALTVLAAPVAGVASWARVSPRTYRRQLAVPLARWRIKRRLRQQWASTVETCGLARRVLSRAGFSGGSEVTRRR